MEESGGRVDEPTQIFSDEVGFHEMQRTKSSGEERFTVTGGNEWLKLDLSIGNDKSACTKTCRKQSGLLQE